MKSVKERARNYGSMYMHPKLYEEAKQTYIQIATEQKAIDIELAWDFFKHDVRINYIHTFGKEPDNGVMEKYKELFIERMEG